MFIGLANIRGGRVEDGIVLLSDAIAANEARNYGIYLPMFLNWLAEAQSIADAVDAGLATAARTSRLIEQGGERINEAELYHVWGGLDR